mgnify:CR=1 FL=1
MTAIITNITIITLCDLIICDREHSQKFSDLANKFHFRVTCMKSLRLL